MGSSHSGKDVPHEAYQRRRVISNQPHIPIEKGIKVFCEYVETPRTNVIFTKCFFPDESIIEQPKGLVCQCLGYTDFTDHWVVLVAQHYVKKGYIFFVWDNYGHGRSSGLWIDIEAMQCLVSDCLFICSYAQTKYPTKNNYLFGLSMGGNIVSRLIIQEHQNKDFLNSWNGVILFSPMVGIDEGIKYNRFVTYLFKRWISYYFPKSIILPKKLGGQMSRDAKMAEWLSQNPLFFPFGPRPRSGVELLNSCEYVDRHSGLIGVTNLPLLVVHGTDDSTTKSSMSMKLVDEVLSKQTVKDATHRLFDGGYHNLMVDLCRNECYDLADEWMQKRKVMD